MHIVRRNDARIKHIAIEMNVDRAPSHRGAKFGGLITIWLDVRDAVPINQFLLVRAQIALANKHYLIQFQGRSQA